MNTINGCKITSLESAFSPYERSMNCVLIQFFVTQIHKHNVHTFIHTYIKKKKKDANANAHPYTQTNSKHTHIYTLKSTYEKKKIYIYTIRDKPRPVFLPVVATQQPIHDDAELQRNHVRQQQQQRQHEERKSVASLFCVELVNNMK